MSGFTGFFQLNARIIHWVILSPLRGGRWISLSDFFHQMVRVGVQAVPMTMLTAFSVGLTLAMQGAGELARMGAASYVPDLVAISMLRELGPLLIGVVIIGRSGSAVTAELGTMKVSEEIEALEVMAIDPVRYLVCPRFLAILVMLPTLTVFGCYIGFVGGWTICSFALHMTTGAYIERLIDASTAMDLYSGFVKSIVFAWLIGTISCQKGLAVTGGAEGVGRNTTGSVVLSIILMLIANAVLTAFFFLLE